MKYQPKKWSQKNEAAGANVKQQAEKSRFTFKFDTVSNESGPFSCIFLDHYPPFSAAHMHPPPPHPTQTPVLNDDFIRASSEGQIDKLEPMAICETNPSWAPILGAPDTKRAVGCCRRCCLGRCPPNARGGGPCLLWVIHSPIFHLQLSTVAHLGRRNLY